MVTADIGITVWSLDEMRITNFEERLDWCHFSSVALNTGEDLALVTQDNGRLLAVDLKNQKAIFVHKADPNVSDSAFSYDGRLFATSSCDGVVLI